MYCTISNRHKRTMLEEMRRTCSIFSPNCSQNNTTTLIRYACHNAFSPECVLSKLRMTFTMNALVVSFSHHEEGFSDKKHPYNGSEQTAQKYQL